MPQVAVIKTGGNILRKTKIVCTLGLASQSEQIIEELMDAGMNVARFNFSHGTHESQKKTFDLIKRLRDKKGLPIATLLDTKGSEVRLGCFAEGKAVLEKGQMFTLTTKPVKGSRDTCSVSYEGLPQDVAVGTTLLIDDGLIEMHVQDLTETEIICRVENGGEISDRKSVNVPGVRLSMPYLNERDRADILFGIQTGFDYIAASFIRCAQDVRDIRQILHEHGAEDIRIIAKIENADGVNNIDEILRVSNGIMVARGDMGVEIPFENLPAIQKQLIQKAYGAGKVVITATQMLDSMIKQPRPTRAEATDVANAIYDGTSAIMLSGETASGLYPVKAVQTMDRIAQCTEQDIHYRKRFYDQPYQNHKSNVTNAIGYAACTTSYDLGAAAIIAVTMSGHSARKISQYRPAMPIIGCTVSERTYQQLALSWGVIPVKIPVENQMDTLFDHAVRTAMHTGIVKNGDLVIIAAGAPLGISGTTNMLKVHIAGDVLLRGTGVGQKTCCGNVCVAHSEQDALLNCQQHDILVIEHTTNALLPIFKSASAIVTEEGGVNSHAAIVGLALDIPVIVGAKGATHLLKSGTVVKVDAERGVVSNCTDQNHFPAHSRQKQPLDGQTDQ